MSRSRMRKANPVIPIDRVRKVRQYFDGVAAKAGRYQGTDLAGRLDGRSAWDGG